MGGTGASITFLLGGNADEMFFSFFPFLWLRVGMKRSECVIGR